MPSLLERLRDAVAPAFTVEHEIGRGGMGIVFLGHDVALDRPVAIKVLQAELASRPAAARFLREARLLAKLSHPNVVPIHQVGELLWYENSDSGIEGWLHGEVHPGEVDAAASAVARLFRSRLAVARHDTAAACGLAPRVAELWAAAEPVYGALVREARMLAKSCAG
jgi:serine/threonine protein kinase